MAKDEPQVYVVGQVVYQTADTPSLVTKIWHTSEGETLYQIRRLSQPEFLRGSQLKVKPEWGLHLVSEGGGRFDIEGNPDD